MVADNRQRIAEFLERNSPDGYFLRFARARVRGYALRQVMTAIGALALGLLEAPWLGLLTAALALLGEGVDCLTLHLIARRYGGKPVPRRVRHLAAASGLFQALTIAACVMLCWQMVHALSAHFFAISFLMSAAMNAGLVRHYFPSGINLRLGVYTATGLMMALSDQARHTEHGPVESWFFVLTAALLGYTTTLFIRANERGSIERTRFELEVLEKSAALIEAEAKERKAARLAERLALAARHANDSVIFTRPDGRIDWVNDAFTRISGYSFDQAVGRDAGDLLNAEATSAEALATLAEAHRAGSSVRVELLNKRRDGQLIWMEISLSPVIGADGLPEVFISVERDITEARRHAEALAEARRAAEAAAQAKSQFLAAMSHEIRTPMNGVIGIAELLEETALEPLQRHYVGTILDSGRALLTIINEVLDLSKLQSEKAELLALPFSVNACLARAVDLLQPSAVKKGLSLSVNLDPELAYNLGDEGRLRQVLLNLLGNALKFTAEGEVWVKVRHQAEAACDHIEIAVSDTGIGIAPERISQVFESFTQADAAISQRFGGTGLGLTISRLLAQRMGGDITLRSELGKGSVFTLSLRLPRAEAGTMAEPAQTTAPVTGLRIIVAEDNRTNMLITRKILEASVASLTEARSGREAVEAYRAAPPDLVLMDVSMPEMSGIEATQEIRHIEAAAGLSRCPIVALTAYASAEEAQMCLAAGMDAVLTKPLARAELYTLLQRLAKARDHFDLTPPDAVERRPEGGPTWSTSQHASGTTSGRSTRSSAR
jgi:two-component system, sensor histidine kinase